SAMVTNYLPSLQFIGNGKGFPIYLGKDSIGKVSNISKSFQQKIDLSEIDIVYYIYAVLNSKEYLERYSNNLKKEFPRIPIFKNKEKFVEIGRKLVDLHLN